MRFCCPKLSHTNIYVLSCSICHMHFCSRAGLSWSNLGENRLLFDNALFGLEVTYILTLNTQISSLFFFLNSLPNSHNSNSKFPTTLLIFVFGSQFSVVFQLKISILCKAVGPTKI